MSLLSMPLALLVLACAVYACAAGVPVTPTAQWQVQTNAGDTLALADREGVLRLDYDVDVKATYQLGHLTFNQATCRLLLAQPVPLGTEQRRILFEAKGMKKIRDRMALLQLLPLVRDASGEILSYEPYPCDHLKEGTELWGRWTTRYFYGAEAGGATQNIFQAEGGDGNAWPDGALTFLGFELQIRPDKFQRVQGTLYLNSIDFGGLRIPYAHPYAYADALLKTKGTYRLAAQIANAFQALPCAEFAQPISYDPASPRSQVQRVRFPLGPDGNYWLRYQLTDETGQVVAGDALRYDVAGNPETHPLPAVSPTAPPVLGYLRVNPEAHTQGVYAVGEPLRAVVRLFPQGAAALTVRWRLVHYQYDTILERGERTVAFEGKVFVDLPLALTGEARRDAYRLLLTVVRDGKTVDQQEYVLGRTTDLAKPYAARTGLIRGRDFVKRSAYFRTTFNLPDLGASEDDYVAQFIAYLDEAGQITPYVTYMVDLAHFEILPGVYDLAALDRIMDAAADRGAAITVRLAHADAKARFRWLPFSRQRSYDGSEIYHHYYGSYSPVDPLYQQGWLQANRVLYARYQSHPAFQGYYLMMAGGEWAVLDKPYLGVIAGYDRTLKDAFRRYLRETRHFTLETLNTRWGATYRGWEAIEPPLPDFTGGTQPDLRVAWLDFCQFKDYLNKEYWFALLAKDIRTYDRERVVIVYCATGEVLEGIADYNHGGGVPGLPGTGEGEAQWTTHRVGAIQEPHHPHRWNAYGDPHTRGWVLDWDLYTMISRAGGGGVNLHVYYFPSGSLPSHYGLDHAYDRYEKFKPLMRELHSMRLIAPTQKQVAVYQDPTTLYCKHRTSFESRLPDLARWFELLTHAGIDHEPMHKARLQQYKLLLPNPLDELLTREGIETLDGYVREGGRLLLSAFTGRYCPELGPDPFPLLRRLGITPPTGPYVQQGEDVQAVVTADNPLFDKGTAVKFYTLTKLRSDPNRPAVREQFFLWPYRWIPQTDYFGYFRDNRTTNGEVLARFPSGGVAISRHTVGRGEVILFWGIPDYTPASLPTLMPRAAQWAGVTDPAKDNAIRLMLEGRSEALNRHYAILWQETPGRYTQRLPNAPDGTFFIDDLVADTKLGTYTGKELRERGIPLTFHDNQSPLQVLRLIPAQPSWGKQYRQGNSTPTP
jgi:hypothetical protein